MKRFLFLRCFFFLLICTLASSTAAELRNGSYEGRSALVLSNGVIELTILITGGSIASIVLQQGSDKTNPLWNSLHQDAQVGLPPRNNGEIGHFVCLDGFGAPSSEEQAAGLPEHGEAQTLLWEKKSFQTQNKISVLTQSLKLALVQEEYTRSIAVVDGENVVLVHSKLDSLLGFDRPVFWVEHAAIGSPFLEPGATVVDLSSNRALTRPWQTAPGTNQVPHRLIPNREFTWPFAPASNGSVINLRKTPDYWPFMDQTGHLMDAGKRFAFVTALNLRKRLLLGYVFQPAEYPWLQNWELHSNGKTITRGLEFGTTVFGRPRRESITENRLFDQLLYRWLPARSSIESTFLMFWTDTPNGFQGVDDIKLESGHLSVIDHRSQQEIVLKMSMPLETPLLSNK